MYGRWVSIAFSLIVALKRFVCVISKLQLKYQRNSDSPCFPSRPFILLIMNYHSYYYRLCWYVGDKYLRDLKSSGASLPPRVLSGILSLADFLVSEARVLETGTEQAKKEVREQIPTDRIKDAPAAARELRWRVKLALGYSSDDEGTGGARKVKNSGTPPIGSKRKRVEDHDDIAHFRNFKPKPWDAVVAVKKEANQTRVSKAAPPSDGDEWTSRWVTEADVGEEAEGEEATVESCQEVVVKVRRTVKGLERQRIERTIEDWTWAE